MPLTLPELVGASDFLTNQELIRNAINAYNNGFTSFNNDRAIKDFNVASNIVTKCEGVNKEDLRMLLAQRINSQQSIKMRTLKQSDVSVSDTLSWTSVPTSVEIETEVPTTNTGFLYSRTMQVNMANIGSTYKSWTKDFNEQYKLWFQHELIVSLRALIYKVNQNLAVWLASNINTTGGSGTTFSKIAGYNQVPYSQYDKDFFTHMKTEAIQNKVTNGFNATITPNDQILIFGSLGLTPMVDKINWNGQYQAQYSATQLAPFDIVTSADISTVAPSDKAVAYMVDKRYVSYEFWNMEKQPDMLLERASNYDEVYYPIPATLFNDFPYSFTLVIRSLTDIEDKRSTLGYQEALNSITRKFQLQVYGYPIVSTSVGAERGVYGYQITNA